MINTNYILLDLDCIFVNVSTCQTEVICVPFNGIANENNNLKDFSDFNYEFTTVINKVSVEFIGENEESIIIKNIKLGV